MGKRIRFPWGYREILPSGEIKDVHDPLPDSYSNDSDPTPETVGKPDLIPSESETPWWVGLDPAEVRETL